MSGPPVTTAPTGISSTTMRQPAVPLTSLPGAVAGRNSGSVSTGLDGGAGNTLLLTTVSALPNRVAPSKLSSGGSITRRYGP